MIRIIEGGFFSDAHEMIKEEVLAAVSAGKRVFLIVPEQQTVTAEAEMADYLPDSSPLFFEATNFTRLANTVFRGLGGADAEYCDRTRRALIMWRTLTELSPLLDMTRGVREVSAGTVDRALAAVSEMQSLGITPDELSKIHGELGEGDRRLGGKLADLSHIMTLYNALIAEKYSDTANDISAMTDKLREHPGFFDGSLFFIEGFTSFTESQYVLIGLLARLECVTVHLTLPKECPDAFEYTEVANAKRRILRECDKVGAEKKLIKAGGRYANHLISECCDLLWRTSGKIDNFSLQYSNQIKLYEAETPYDECDFIAADIRGRVAKGAKFRDFAIIARSAEDYAGIIDGSLDRAGIPHFLSKRRDVSSFEAVKLIYTAFSVISGGYRREDIITYAKCSPSGISRGACDEFELYTEMWQISGRRFTDGVIWSMNPDGYTTRRQDDCDERLLAINETRSALILPLTELEDECSRAKTVRDYATALVSFLDRIGLERSICERAAELVRLGEEGLAKETSVLWGVICDSLDTLVSTLGDTPATKDAFLSQLKTVFSNADIGRIPAYYDAVTIGSADMLRLSGKKHVYMIGINRGEFPRAISDSSFFSDRDKTALSELGLAIEPDADVKSARELYCFSRAFSYAKETLTLIYTQKNAGLRDIRRADVIDRIVEITDGAIKPINTASIQTWRTFYSPESALENLGNLSREEYAPVSQALSAMGHDDRICVAEGRIENDKLAVSSSTLPLIYNGPLSLSQSKIDAYNKCPLAYYCRYNLSLLPNERAEFDARNIGSFVHAILESFFEEVHFRGLNPGEIDDNTRQKMVERGARSYLSQLGDEDIRRSRREEILIARLCRATMPVVNELCEEFASSRFLPRYFELKIARGNERFPEPCEFHAKSGPVFVGGSIDRVDVYKQDGEVYVRVIDYKTGSKDFSPSDLDEGKNLQMFLYLKAIVDTKNEKFLHELGVEDGKHPIPAGVIYVKTELGDVRISSPDEKEASDAIKKAQGRQGMLLDDKTSLAAMNAAYIPVKITKSGAPDKRSADKLYTTDGWAELCEKTSRAVERTADDMRSGKISATPRTEKNKSPCEYCKFKPFCRNIKI